APNLRPDVRQLVIVPMPVRTSEHVITKAVGVGGKWEGGFAKWKENDALALFVSECLLPSNGCALQIFAERFHAKGDRRIGFYTLLLASGPHALDTYGSYFAHKQGSKLAVETEHPKEPLAKLLGHVVMSNYNSAKTYQGPLGNFGAAKGSFLARFAEY